MTKILTFFNHKGGVGKTTLAYNVAWGLSNAGKRVLMIDADAQCNLTEISVDDDCLYGDDLSSKKCGQSFFLKNNINEYFTGYILPELRKELPQIETFNKKENLALLSGSIDFAQLEETISLSIAGIAALKHVPSSTYTALQNISKDFDWIVIDLSPALSATNRLFLMLSDYFIVPVNPSIFSMQALRNLNTIFRSWNLSLSGFDIFSKKTKNLPKLLGIVCQNYRPYSRADEKNTTSAERFEKSMEALNSVALQLATDLNSFGMALTPSEFGTIFENSTPYRIANIPDYNQLKVISETEKFPVHAFTPSILNKYSLNIQQYRKKIDDFSKECAKIIDGLLKLS
jgi:cellulose biosynthesis protein BcsQ